MTLYNTYCKQQMNKMTHCTKKDDGSYGPGQQPFYHMSHVALGGIFHFANNAPKQEIVCISKHLSRICGRCDDEMNNGRMWQIMWKSDLECLSPISRKR